jgi:hypothetical protein
MAVTANHANNEIVKWQTRVLREWRRGNLFAPYMGNGITSIIRFYRDLEGEQGGDQVNVPFVGRLSGPGVSTGPLVGNEEKMDTYGFRMWIDWARNAVLLKRSQMRRSSIDQLELVRPLLTEWGQTKQRDEIIYALDAIPSETVPADLGNDTVGGQRVNGILWSAATTAQKNTFLTQNSDRILFGNAVGNTVAGNMASSLANVDSTNDRLTAASLLLMKRLARRADPGITPYQNEETAGREYFVTFAGSNTFRDLAADPVMVAANRDARAREGGGMDDNPLFQDGDLLYRGVIVREVPEIDTLAVKTAAGASSINVSPVFMCGQSAVAFPWGQAPKPVERKEDDYGMVIGRGIEAVYGIGKVARKIGSTGYLKQHGVVTGFFASIDDA